MPVSKQLTFAFQIELPEDLYTAEQQINCHRCCRTKPLKNLKIKLKESLK